MKEFLGTIKDSIYGPGFYSEIPQKTLTSSFGYFFMLVTTLTLITATMVSLQLVPRIMSFLNNIPAQATNYYPDNLEITAKGGQISTNVAEPYFFAMPDQFKNATSDLQNLLVIDTKNPFSIDLFKQYKTAALLTKDSFVAYNKGEIRIQSLASVPNGTFTKAKFTSLLNMIGFYFKFIPGILVILIFIGLFIVRTLDLLYLAIATLIVLLIMKIKKMNGGYKRSYQIGLYAMTLSMIVETFVTVTNLPMIPYAFTIIFVIVLLANVRAPEPAVTIQ